MATSFAVWIEDKNNDSNSNDKTSTESGSSITIDELHINFWCTKKPTINCIDIGVKFSASTACSNSFLNIHIPFAIGKERIEDLTSKMISNHNLIEAIFNDYIISFQNERTKHVILNLASKKDENLILNTNIDFSDYEGKFDERTSVLVNKNYSTIKFPLSKCIISTRQEKNQDKYYIRLRLNNLTEDEMNKFRHKTENADKFLKPFKEQLIVIDFRINELRVLPKDIRIGLANAVACPMIYHLFIIRDETAEYQLSHSGKSYKKCRILEGETWKNYFESGNFKNNQSSMIYHWEKKYDTENAQPNHKLTDFIAVAKFKEINSPFITILIYIFMIIFFGLASCYIYDLFKLYLPALNKI